MKLERLDLLHIRRRLAKPFRISVGEIKAREFLLLRGQGEGFTVYGEVNIDLRPFYTDEFIASARDVIVRDLAPLVLNREIASARDVQALWPHVRGHHFAKAGIEALFWDLEGKVKGRSIASLIGGERSRLEIGTSHSIFPSVNGLLEDVEKAVEAGVPRIKLKIQPGWDLKPLQAVADQFPHVQLMGDANAAYTAAQMNDIKALDPLHLCMIEQPFAHFDLCAHSELKRHFRTPVCMDESLHDLDLVRSAVAMRALDIVNIKVGRVGGLSASLAIRDYCQPLGIPLWCGRRTGSGISIALELAMASLPEFSYPTDHGIEFLQETLDHLVDLTQFDYHQGTVAVPQGPGIGVEVDQATLRSTTVCSEVVA